MYVALVVVDIRFKNVKTPKRKHYFGLDESETKEFHTFLAIN